jgi:hypothetical protein
VVERAVVRNAQLIAMRLGRKDVGACVVAVESAMRPYWWRTLEYAALMILLVIRPSRAHRMSLGRAQVPYVTLTAYLRSLGESCTLARLLRAGERISLAADMAAYVAAGRPVDQSLSQWYTGGHNPYYDHLLELAYGELRGTGRFPVSLTKTLKLSSSQDRIAVDCNSHRS